MGFSLWDLGNLPQTVSRPGTCPTFPDMDKPSYLNFDKSKYAWRPDVDYREQPELYRVGKGEQGVLICEPHKGELVRLWRFKTPEIATESSKAIYK